MPKAWHLHVLFLLLAVSAIPARAQLSVSVSLPAGKIGLAFTAQVLASGGTAPYHFTLPAGNPPFAQITDNGVLTGTPMTSGSFVIQIKVTDSATVPASVTGDFPFTVAQPPPPLVISTTSLPAGVLGASYNASVSAQGGTPPYNYVGTSLPGNLQVNLITGAVYAQPLSLAPGTYSFGVTVSDNSSPQMVVQKNFSISVSAGLVVYGGGLADGTYGQPYSGQITGVAGVAPYSFSVVSGTLPPGLTLNTSSAIVSGTPSHRGYYAFGVKVTDATGLSGTADYSININGIPLSVTGSLPAVSPVGQPFPTTAFAVSGGAPPYVVTLETGSVIPPGMSFNGTTLSGTPTQAGGYLINIKATDQGGNTGSFYASTAILGISPASLDSGAVGSPYYVTFSGDGMPQLADFGKTAGSFPPGLSLSGPNLSGTPTTAGTFNFTLVATAGAPYTVTKSYSLVIAPLNQGTLTITPASPGSRVRRIPLQPGYDFVYEWNGPPIPLRFSTGLCLRA